MQDIIQNKMTIKCLKNKLTSFEYLFNFKFKC